MSSKVLFNYFRQVQFWPGQDVLRRHEDGPVRGPRDGAETQREQQRPAPV